MTTVETHECYTVDYHNPKLYRELGWDWCSFFPREFDTPDEAENAFKASKEYGRATKYRVVKVTTTAEVVIESHRFS